VTTNDDEYPVSEITLHALEGTPLRHDRIREMVVATTEAIAERQGVAILAISTSATSITVQVRGEEIVAMGLMTEMRRLTTNWYKHRFGVDALWGEARASGDD